MEYTISTVFVSENIDEETADWVMAGYEALPVYLVKFRLLVVVAEMV